MIRHKGVHIVLGYRFLREVPKILVINKCNNYVYLHVFYCTYEPQI